MEAMKDLYFLLFAALGISFHGSAQVLISDNTMSNEDPTVVESCAIIQLNSADKGLLVPRATTDAIDTTTGNSTTSGMLTYDPTDNVFYIKTDEAWVRLN